MDNRKYTLLTARRKAHDAALQSTEKPLLKSSGFILPAWH
ncbi:hypothetical protein HPTD01_727 [Halomonas sp. TD01]|nr:hypothetical protein HPTD01_727 [Halomonas sp. TD01]